MMRLPKQREKEHIIEVCRNSQDPMFIRKKGLFLIVYLGFSVFGFAYSYLINKDLSVALWVGIIIFLILIGMTIGILIPYVHGIKKIPELLEADKILVEEATYDKTSVRYNTTYVMISDHGRKKYKGIDVTRMEKFESGDQILIVKNRWFKWAFKKA